MNKLPINWFDFAVVAVLVVGFLRGRKHGLSQELMHMLQWLLMVIGAGLLYKPVGDFVADVAVVSHLFAYIFCYISLIVAIKIIFVVFKKALGGKLAGSDVFGKGEYYFGIFAGMIRFSCILILVLSLLNAKYSSPEQIASMNAFQKDVYGSDFFPTLSTVQTQVFEDSMAGPQIKNTLGFLLIEPTAPEEKKLKRREDYL